jgi:GNAT superfamily N-acetyltransferase
VTAAELHVERVRDADEAHVAALSRLLPQLSSTAPAPGADELAHLLDPAGPIRLFAARLHEAPDDPGRLVGYAVLVVFTSLTGTRGWVEDVVVDEAARNHGVGTRLVERLVEAATEEGCRTLDLTSRPAREAANRLYARCGFLRRDTNVWRHDLHP